MTSPLKRLADSCHDVTHLGGLKRQALAATVRILSTKHGNTRGTPLTNHSCTSFVTDSNHRGRMGCHELTTTKDSSISSHDHHERTRRRRATGTEPNLSSTHTFQGVPKNVRQAGRLNFLLLVGIREASFWRWRIPPPRTCSRVVASSRCYDYVDRHVALDYVPWIL